MVPLFPPKIAFLMTVHQISGFVYTWTKAAQKLIVQIKKKNRLSQLSFSPLLALFSLSQRRPLHPLRRLSDGHRLGVLHGRLGLGGIAIVHYNNTPFDQYSIIRSAKSRRIPFASETIFKSPSDFVDSGDDFASSPCVFVTQNGDSKSELLGLVSRSYGAPLVSGEDGEVVDVFSAKDVERIRGFRRLGAAVVGADGDFMVGAAMGTRFVLAFSKASGKLYSNFALRRDDVAAFAYKKEWNGKPSKMLLPYKQLCSEKKGLENGSL
ncbi:hypothetical protein Syun_020739 [Stephania yunnanensis]|uniref:Uncharacterized protein n=1 Tax=Stephania yunnanensis TaxID=152371 RepID=A0AAP0IGA5_9MAGN